MEYLTTEEVLKNIKAYKEELKATGEKGIEIESAYDSLNIFDWWDYYLTLEELERMEKLIAEATKLGYSYRIIFKQASDMDYANGCWAYASEEDYKNNTNFIFNDFIEEGLRELANGSIVKSKSEGWRLWRKGAENAELIKEELYEDSNNS